MIKKACKIGAVMALLLMLILLGGCSQTVDITDNDTPLTGPDEAAMEMIPEEGEIEPAVFELLVEAEPEPTEQPEPDPEPESVPVEVPVVEEKKPEPHQEPIPAPEPEATEDVGVQEPPAVVEYTATFLHEDGSRLTAVHVAEGEALTAPSIVPEKEGHMFAYWFERGAGQSPYSFGAAIESDITLVAHFDVIEKDEKEKDEETDAAEAEDDLSVNEENKESTDIIDDESSAEDESNDAELPVPDPIEEKPEAHVEAVFSFEGDHLVEGAVITLTAIVSDPAEGETFTIQWQNDASGDFVDVPGATGITYAFVATPENTGCQWRAVMRGN